MIRPMIVACSKMRNVNLSSIARAASGFGIHTIIGLGYKGRVKRHVSRGAQVEVKNRSITYLEKLKRDGYRIVALELTPNSIPLPSYKFDPKTVLVAGNENRGVSEKILAMVDDVVEIPMFGTPPCHNVAIATSIAMYEYTRQFPDDSV